MRIRIYAVGVAIISLAGACVALAQASAQKQKLTIEQLIEHGYVLAMPAKPSGVYVDGRGGWYFKARLPADAATGRREQVTKRGATFNRIMLARVAPENNPAMMVAGKGQKPLGSCIVEKTSLVAKEDPAGGFFLQAEIDS